ncbi:uncharacterized protein LOC130528968 isoform X2 [Takifugu flavidus]|uniref:uncharacterized protein LOC130528968 isoform X2 n=1 Tax=Takifugu flavidus TaxID=433684 RepID=UPI00254418A6|nr:uncharacterized protein LOC130528968 isoform X2 [Takifugu flavidus]
MGNGVTASRTWREPGDPKVCEGGSAPYWLWQPQQVGLMGNQKDQFVLSHIIREFLHPDLEANFVKRCRRRLIKSIQPVDAIVDALREVGVLNTANLEAISIHADQREKQRILVDQVLWKGNKAQDAFFLALARSNPFILQELDRRALKNQGFSEGSIQEDLVDFLVPDEEKWLHWVLRDHLMEGDSNGPRTHGPLQKHFGFKQLDTITKKVLLKIVPTLSTCLEKEELVTSESSSAMTTEKNLEPEVEVSPDVFEDGDMFRLQCEHQGLFHCRLTGLRLEGVGDVLYQLVPWDLDFLSSKGLRPAGPLFRFTLLSGRFHRLHLPHCQLLEDVAEGGQHFLSVVHATEERVDFITPSHVTQSHVIVDVPGFSCFGLVTGRRNNSAIRGLVVLFSEIRQHLLFVLLLPRNICLTQVIKEWKRRIGAKYVETVPDCELIPNHTYKLSGQPVTLIQPEVQLPDEATSVKLQLSSPEAALPLIGWLFRSTDSVTWERVVQLRAHTGQPEELCPAVAMEEPMHTTLILLQMLQSLESEDFLLFHYHLKLRPNPIPVSRLENADRPRTVDLMVQQYQPEGAKQVTEEIFRMMKFEDLADQLRA